MTRHNPNLDLAKINAYIKFDEFHPFVLKILSGNENLISLKGHSSVTNLRKMTVNNPKLDLVNINTHAKFGQIYQLVLKILSGNEILKEILTSVKGHNPRGGTLNFSTYVGSDPASTLHPKKISGISSTPKKYLKVQQPPKNPHAVQ